MPEKLRYSQLVETVARESGKSKQMIHTFFVELVQEIKADLQREGRVHLAGLGRFRLVWSEERQGRNPQTGEAITIPAHNRILFKPDAAIRRLINRDYQSLKPTILENNTANASAPPEPFFDENPIEEKPVEEIPAEKKESAEKQPSLTEELIAAASFSGEDTPPKPEPPIESPVTPATLKASGTSITNTEKPEVKQAEKQTVQPEITAAPPPVTVKVVREEKQTTITNPPPEGEKQKRKLPLWAWLVPLLLVIVIVILIIFWPTGNKPAQPAVAEITKLNPVQEEPAVTEPEPAPPPEKSSTGTPGGIHIVKSGDNLWGISTVFYKDAYLWPNILRVNLTTVKNPDFLKRGLQVDVPSLQGSNGHWTLQDREQIAEGYIHAYLLYHNRDKGNATHYLWVARNTSETIFNKFKDRIDQTDQTAILAIKGRSRY